jgi:hypothetical protein
MKRLVVLAVCACAVIAASGSRPGESAQAAKAYPGFHTPKRAVFCRYAISRPLGLTCWRPRDGYTVAMHVYGKPITGFQYLNRHAYEDAAPTLRYGKMWGSFRVIGCKSTQTGLTCKNRRGHGWTIGKVSYKVF